MTGYFLKGSRDEYLIVMRSEDLEEIKTLIQRIDQMRDKGMQALAKDLKFSLDRIENE